MAARLEQIIKEIAKLPRRQRLTLVRLLLDLDRLGTGTGTGTEVDTAWDEEIRARIKAIDDGRAVGIPYNRLDRKWRTDRPSAHR